MSMKQGQTDSTPSRFRSVALICLLLVLLTFTVYVPVCRNGFSVLDDDDYVVRNGYVQAGITWETFKWAMTTDAIANWHPLTWLSHMLDCQLFGLNAGPQHLTNVILHILNTVLVFLIFRSLTRATWRSALIAVLFGVHPLHVESVAWISERKDVLSTFFWLLTTGAYVSYVRRRGVVRYLSVMVLLALGLMAKPMLVTLPFVLLLLDYWPLDRFQPVSGEKGKKPQRSLIAIFDKLPLIAIAVASSIITFVVQQRGGAVRSIDSVSLWARFGNAAVGYVRYLGKAFWPHDLAVYYPYNFKGLPVWQVAFALLLLLALSLLVIRYGRRFRYLVVGWLWFLGTLVPVIGIVQVGTQAIADRYMYVPILGLFIIVVWGGADLGLWMLNLRHRKEQSGQDLEQPARTKAKRNSAPVPAITGRKQTNVLLAIPAIVLVGILSATCMMQVQWWRSNVTLFQHAVDLAEDNDVGLFNLGIALKREGRLVEAEQCFKKAVQIRPNYVNALIYLGVICHDEHRLDEAIKHYETAIEYATGHPSQADAENNLGAALVAKGRPEDAIPHYQKAIEIMPLDADKQCNLGIALNTLKRYDEAAARFSEALRIDPNHTYARDSLAEMKANPQARQGAIKVPELASADEYFKQGNALADKEKFAEAAAYYEAALKLRPDFIDARVNMGNALAVQGRLREAIAQFEEVLKKNPGNVDAHINIGNASAELGNLDRAEKEYGIALRANPRHVQARCALGYALIKHGKVQEAYEEFSRALAVDPKCENARTALKTIKEHLDEK